MTEGHAVDLKGEDTLNCVKHLVMSCGIEELLKDASHISLLIKKWNQFPLKQFLNQDKFAIFSEEYSFIVIMIWFLEE